MNTTTRLLALVTAIVLFIITAVLAFTWLGTSTDLRNVVGFLALGLVAFAASFLP